MGNIIKGYPQVSRSITNPNVNRDDALDKFAPFSFLTFIKNVEESFAPDTLQDFYTAYINRWSKISTKKTLGNNELIIERYKDFLKDIALNFSTNAEKKFLTQIDFNDKNDLRIVISYYSKKIRDIITYYNKKRNSLHFSAIKSKVKGTNINLQQTARELILDFLENTNTGKVNEARSSQIFGVVDIKRINCAICVVVPSGSLSIPETASTESSEDIVINIQAWEIGSRDGNRERIAVIVLVFNSLASSSSVNTGSSDGGGGISGGTTIIGTVEPTVHVINTSLVKSSIESIVAV